MVINGDLWWFMVIYDDVQWYMMIYGSFAYDLSEKPCGM